MAASRRSKEKKGKPTDPSPEDLLTSLREFKAKAEGFFSGYFEVVRAGEDLTSKLVRWGLKESETKKLEVFGTADGQLFAVWKGLPGEPVVVLSDASSTRILTATLPEFLAVLGHSYMNPAFAGTGDAEKVEVPRLGAYRKWLKAQGLATPSVGDTCKPHPQEKAFQTWLSSARR